MLAGWNVSWSSTNATWPLYRFRDEPRVEGVSFIKHLHPRHGFHRLMIVSGDRESEVRYLAEQIGISEVYAEKTPEEKVTIVRAETQKARTLYVGDGINDAPALMSATVGVAIGKNSDITTESAGVVIMDSDSGKGRRVHAHQPTHATDCAAERNRRHGPERDRDGPGQRRYPDPRGRRGEPGGDRRVRGLERAACRPAAEQLTDFE